MPTERDEIFSRVKRIEREFLAVRLAMDHLLAIARQDPTQLTDQFAVRDVEKVSEHLEGTYFIRLFAEFESALRHFWTSTRQNRPPRKTEALINQVGAMRNVSETLLEKVHLIREYRNHLVHGRKEVQESSLSQARGELCTFLSILPVRW